MKESLLRMLNTPVEGGTVTGLRNGMAEIATARGRLDAAAPSGGMGLRVGDTVQVANGAVIRINRPGPAETYFV